MISGRIRPAVRDEPTMHDSFFRIGSDHQQGFVLMVGLLMLAMLSVIGMELARTALLEEKMVGAFVHNLKASIRPRLPYAGWKAGSWRLTI
ncbi:MAG: hypothetical protein CM1200mP20_01380 [Pseudomonadota bacterium]|nr:MAG: hypothetical protein CM1200mP20_01380 [Pseudomonadota bacterium]